MKKVCIVAVLACLAICGHAQIVTSRSSMITRDSRNWSTFGVEYLPSSLKGDGGSVSFSGIAVNYTHAASITQDFPLFFEYGIGAQFSFYSHKDGNYESKFNFLSLKVPANIVYDIKVTDANINIDPYIGLRLRGNVWGEIKETDFYGDTEKGNLFSSDEGGCKRLQVGWAVGIKARFNNAFFVGVGYGTDFNDFSDGVKINEVSLSVGLVF